jgi:hypothetical protein
MKYRSRLIAVTPFVVAVMTVSAQPAAKTVIASKTVSPSKTWKQPMTPWGDPDLQGVWPSTSMIHTPIERDSKLGTRALLNDEEVAKKMEQNKFFNRLETGNPNGVVPLAAGWFDSGKPNRQASLVVDPPDGRIPPLTTEAQVREAARKKRWNEKKDSPDTWLDLTTWDRCITLGPIGSVAPFAYNNGQQIVQGPGYVIFRNEMIHEARVIPLDGRPHASPEIRTWMGDSRGHWEGNTLVVDTTNFNGQTFIGSQGGGFGDSGAVATDHLRLVERFTRVDENTINYEVTIDDPYTWTKPWKIAMPLRHEANYDYLYEYSCHEGNIFMHDALAGARAEEKKAAEAAAHKGVNQ